MAKEQSCNTGIGVLAGAIDSSQTTLVLVVLTGLPAAAPFNVRVEDEILRVTAVNAGTKTYTVTRGAEGTTAAAHATGLNVYHPLTLAGLKCWNEQLLNGTAVANQRGLNFIPASANLTIALAEDAANENCNVTIGLGANVVLATGSYADPAWVTSLAGSKVAGNIAGNAAGLTAAIAESQVTGLVADLTAKAPLASPTFTGTPIAPTATAGTSTTQVATTAFVAAGLAQVAAVAGANVAYYTYFGGL